MRFVRLTLTYFYSKTDQMHNISNLFYFGATPYMLYVFFWVIPRRLKFICRRFGTLCLFHLHREVGK